MILNPSCDLKLEEGDLIYIIKPNPIKTKKSFITRGSSMRGSKSSFKNARNSDTSQICSKKASSQSTSIADNQCDQVFFNCDDNSLTNGKQPTVSTVNGSKDNCAESVIKSNNKSQEFKIFLTRATSDCSIGSFEMQRKSLTHDELIALKEIKKINSDDDTSTGGQRSVFRGYTNCIVMMKKQQSIDGV